MPTPRVALSEMPVVILCGGQGTRLREETEYRPKPMVEIGGQPILWHILKLYGHHGLEQFLLCLGYKGWVIKQYFLRLHELMRDFTVRHGSPRAAGLPQPRGRGALAGDLRRDRRGHRHRRAAVAGARLHFDAARFSSPTAMRSATSTSRRCSRSTTSRGGSPP